jgi:antitoxin (DNA-binding transcriptional repressor) of toxin-antitoxin stability system
MPQKGDRRRGKPLSADLGYSGDPVHHSTSRMPPQRIGIRELRQHASIYVDLVERGYTVDITNRGRLVAQMIPVRQPDSPLERWIAAGVVERAEESGSVLDVDPYPPTAASRAADSGAASEVLRQMRADEGEGAS